mgnify:CR=1 FL=1
MGFIKTCFNKSFGLMKFKKNWRKRNVHNLTVAKNIFPIDKVDVGRYTYGPLNILTFGNPKEHLKIGSFCSIGPDVKFLLGGEHPYRGVSTFPFKVKVCGFEYEAKTKGPIVIEDDVWIGANSIVLSGVHIGQGAIIVAGSVVAKDVPPYAIFTGNKVIRYRFPENVTEKLLNFDYSKLEDTDIKENIDLLYEDLGESFFNSKLYMRCQR